MVNRTSAGRHEAARHLDWQLRDIGREIRVARLMSGRTQRVVARSVGTSVARISLVERGHVRSITHRQLVTIAAAVGLKLSVRAYPTGRRLLDQPQLALFSDLRARAHPSWQWRTEVPMPIAGDLRAADAVAAVAACTILFELWTRLADWQAQSRGALLKARDLQTTRLIAVLRATRANRHALRLADPASLGSFPLGSRDILRALADARDPGANGILLLSSSARPGPSRRADYPDR